MMQMPGLTRGSQLLQALVAPLSGGAAAARALMLGTRNALDPERYEERHDFR